MGLWVIVVGAHGMEVGIKVDDNISHCHLGVLVTWEVFGIVNNGCCGWVSSLP